MTQQRLQGLDAESSADPGQPNLLEALMQLQEMLQPLCHQEVAWVASHAGTLVQDTIQGVQLAGDPAGMPEQQGMDTTGTQQQSARQTQAVAGQVQAAAGQAEGAARKGQAAAGQAQAATGQAKASAGQPMGQVQAAAGQEKAAARELTAAAGPWDWDYLQHLATQSLTSALQQEAGLLQQHLQLPGVVAGFAALLHSLLGLRLVLRAAADAEVWAPHVLVLDVWQKRQQPEGGAGAAELLLLGTVYLDVGGGYGARVLRYARTAPSSGGASYQHAAVAVGISGSRIPAPAAAVQEGADAAADCVVVPEAARLLLSVSQLWELAHELGHAVHLVASSR
jgi:Zn-dependent oligopeptidase